MTLVRNSLIALLLAYIQLNTSLPTIKIKLPGNQFRLQNSLTDDNFEKDKPTLLLRENLSKLKQDREKKRALLAANELAIKTVEAELSKYRAENGSVSAFPLDYGFISKSSGCYVDSTNPAGKFGTGPPTSGVKLGILSFGRELKSILNIFANKNDQIVNRNSSTEVDLNVMKLKQLKLSNEAIWKRESERPAVKTPFIIKIPYLLLCYMLDALFQNNPISRFWFLETVARIPYFSYITMLHTYETLGWWRRSAEAKRIHFAEEWNEFHHLLIMESLGGDQEWAVRFFAQHSAIVYYFVLLFVWFLSPSLAYNFSELIESHAVDTYAEFAESNKELLSTLPAPYIAKAYYEADDMYTFDEFQTSRVKGSRRPQVNTLYDVFCCIRDDEAEHVATMAACQDPDTVIRSPNTEAAILIAAAASTAVAYLVSEGNIDLSYINTITNGLGGGDILEGLGAATTVGAGAAASTLAGAEEQLAQSNAEQLVEEASAIGFALKWIKSLLPFIL